MRFLAVIITGLALAAPAAHAFALLNKIGMAKADYFIAQQAYAGWWIVGLLFRWRFWRISAMPWHSEPTEPP
jgi:hypothetical protein